MVLSVTSEVLPFLLRCKSLQFVLSIAFLMGSKRVNVMSSFYFISRENCNNLFSEIVEQITMSAWPHRGLIFGNRAKINDLR
jgi:hypothetical protein